ncbi:MAG: cell division protein FtsQ/DivIB [Pseudonocardia sp.]
MSRAPDPAGRAGRAAWATRAQRSGRSPGRTGRSARQGPSRAGGGASRAGTPLPEHIRRRRRLAAAALTIGFVLVAGAVGGRALLYDAGLADVEALEVTGLATVPEQAVREAAAVGVGLPLAGVDLAGVERRVEQIPAVADAEAGRDWPHTVIIAVTERVPVAVAETPRGPHLVDDTGVAFLPAPDPAALPHLAVGVLEPGAGATPAARAALDVLAALPGPVHESVRAVEVGPPPALPVTLTLTGDRQVRWGSPDRATTKAAVLGALLSQPGSVYDVASPELPTIRR